MHLPTTNPKHISITPMPTDNTMATTPRRSTMLDLVFDLASVPELRDCDLARMAAAQVATGQVVLTGNYAHTTAVWA